MENVLIVDDDEILLDGLKSILHKNFNVKTVSNSEDAINALNSSGPYAIIVSDLKMSGLNGIEFLEKSREISPFSIRILLTGYAETESTIQAINQCEIFRLRTKPCSAELLRNTLFEGIKKYWSSYNKIFQKPLSPDTISNELKYNHTPEYTKYIENNDISLLENTAFTPKEIRILELLRMSISTKEIAEILNISKRTVECHRQNIRTKLNLKNKKINLQAVILAQ